MIDDLRLRRLASTQRGLASVAQSCDLGYTNEHRRRLIDGRRWERLTDRVLRLVGTPDTAEQRALLAVLDAGTGGALAGPSAAAWWGIPGNRLEPLHVARTRDRSTTQAPNERRHEPTLLAVEHTLVLDGIRTVVPARALFDIAGLQRGGAKLPWFAARMSRMVDNAWSARLISGVTIHAMLDELAQRGRPGIRVMRGVLSTRDRDYVPPASNLEARAIQILADSGLPAMRRQVDTGDAEGWIGRVDLRDEVLPLIVEVQSERFHSSLTDRELDRLRISRLERAGFVVVELWEHDVWHRPRAVVDAVREGRRLAATLVRQAS